MSNEIIRMTSKLNDAISSFKEGKKPLTTIYIDIYRQMVDDHICKPVHSFEYSEISQIAFFYQKGYSFQKIGDRIWPEHSTAARKKRAEREVKKNIVKYPKLFKSDNR